MHFASQDYVFSKLPDIETQISEKRENSKSVKFQSHLQRLHGMTAKKPTRKLKHFSTTFLITLLCEGLEWSESMNSDYRQFMLMLSFDGRLLKPFWTLKTRCRHLYYFAIFNFSFIHFFHHPSFASNEMKILLFPLRYCKVLLKCEINSSFTTTYTEKRLFHTIFVFSTSGNFQPQFLLH